MIYEFVKGQFTRSLFLGKLSDLFAGAGHALARWGRGSALVTAVRPFFARPDLLRKKREDSVLCHAASVCYGWFLALIRRILAAFSSLWPFSLLVRLIDWLISLRISTITAVLLAVMLTVDDSRWSNGYMLLAALFVGALYLIERAEGKGERPIRLPVSAWIFLGCTALAIVGGIFVSEALHVFFYFVTSFIFMLVLAGTVRDMRDFRRVFMILYCAVIFTSLIALLQAKTGIAVNTSYTDVTVDSGMPGRAYATFYNPNNFAEILVLLTPCALVSFLTEERITKAARVFIVLTFALPVVALLLTYSRASWISFALVIGSFVALSNLKLIPLFLLLFLLAIPVLPASITNRVLTLFNGRDTSMGYRLMIWDASCQAVRYNPWSGGGLGTKNFYDAYRKFMEIDASVAAHAHNLFLEIWLETGIFGFLSMVTFYFSTLKNTLLSVTHGDRSYRFSVIAMFSTLFGMFFVEMVEYIWFYPRVMLVFWSVLGLAWALLRIAPYEGTDTGAGTGGPIS